MSDPEESSASLIGVLVAIAIAVVISVVLFMQPTPAPTIRAPATELTGVVQSSGPITLSRSMGGTRERAMVQLSDGSVVPALVGAGGPLSPGDRVVLSPFTAPTAGFGLGLPQYEVVAKK
jgi:hypothetical protein